jgi:hypothetical protein
MGGLPGEWIEGNRGKKRGIPSDKKEMPLGRQAGKLDARNVGRRETLGAFSDIERYLVALAEGFEAGCIDRGMVDENVRSIFLLDETESLLVVKPFYGTISHDVILLS